MTTATTKGARDHARAQAGQITDSMPVLPASEWPWAPSDIDPLTFTWAETVPGGRYASKVLGRGTRLRLTDITGSACVNIVLLRADAPWERLNVADTVKVPWQAYLGAGHPLLSDQGRVLATIVADSSGHHDTFCGTTTLAGNTAKYGAGELYSASPAGRELFTLAAAKHGLTPRDIGPSVSFFHGIRAAADGALHSTGTAGPGRSGSADPLARHRPPGQHRTSPGSIGHLRHRPRSGIGLDHARRTGRSSQRRSGISTRRTQYRRRMDRRADGKDAVKDSTILDEVVPARAPWSTVVAAGDVLTIIDLRGNQAVDTLLYSAADTGVRYSAQATIAAQSNLFLRAGTVLRAEDGSPLMTIVEDEVGSHDTIGGACSQESNTLRYGHHTKHQHACVENFLLEGAKWGLGKRDLVSNINFYMNVPVDDDGTLGIVDGLSAPGKRIKLRAEVDTLVLVSNCPQINNPCNGFDPTPVRMVVESL